MRQCRPLSGFHTVDFKFQRLKTTNNEVSSKSYSFTKKTRCCGTIWSPDASKLIMITSCSAVDSSVWSLHANFSIHANFWGQWWWLFGWIQNSLFGRLAWAPKISSKLRFYSHKRFKKWTKICWKSTKKHPSCLLKLQIENLNFRVIAKDGRLLAIHHLRFRGECPATNCVLAGKHLMSSI